MEVQQVTAELDRMRALYLEKQPQRVLEIGCLDGGTLREWLQNAVAGAVVVAVDLQHRNLGAYEEWQLPDTRLQVLTGSSQSEEMIAAVRAFAPYDWAFIDGDHDETAVRSDAVLGRSCVRPGGLILFHDIVPGPGLPATGPGVVVADMKWARYKVEEIVEDPGEWPWAHGIGVVQL